jgi:hypothetical protein
VQPPQCLSFPPVRFLSGVSVRHFVTGSAPTLDFSRLQSSLRAYSSSATNCANRSPASFDWTCHEIRTSTWRTDRHLECRTRRHEPAVDRRPTTMSFRGCIGDADQVWRPAVNPNEQLSSVENPTFDALCGLVRRPAVTHSCYSTCVRMWIYAEYSGAQP